MLDHSFPSESSSEAPIFRRNARLWALTKRRFRDFHFGRTVNGKRQASTSVAVQLGSSLETSIGDHTSQNRLERPQVRGKFLFVGDEKFWVRGVTYGTFRPDEGGANYPPRDIVERDFADIKNAGFNAVRVYTVPPRWLLDLAAAHQLRLMIGLPWEQHIAFLEDKSRVRDITRRVSEYVRQCAGHPAVLCYAIGNEIPASVVRWYGRRRIQKFLGQLCKIVRHEDPDALLTYVNYPTTEYLELPCIDFVAFNVYLESKEKLAAYLARLQNLAGECPLLMAEVGLDSRRKGEEAQAAVLKWQIETIFERGCVGAFVFAWTDEWHRGGYDIEDWDFGLTTRDRHPKPALGSVSRAFEEIPFARDQHWPRMSVVVCSYNGAKTIGETLTALGRLNYPDYEVIVVNDGSTDATPSIARQHNVRLIETQNKGLSHARNLGMEATTGEIIAYIDDDAYPDADWLSYLAASFKKSQHVGIGGPNLAPAGDGVIADAVAHAPGGPVHVLLSDDVAEHIPGCNMAFRVNRLREVGGFDPRFRVAGDDVDICWRLQECGWTLGYSPAAVVWHHRRRSLGAYWKQQKAYAKAESLLAEKWPQKYNGAGHLNWSGRLYGNGITNFFLSRPRVYHGMWGSALFQSVYEPAGGLLSAIPLMPEWYFLLSVLVTLSALSVTWSPLFVFVPVLAIAIVATLLQAGIAVRSHQRPTRLSLRELTPRTLIFWLNLIQPMARLLGRIRNGIGPWDIVGLLRGPLRLTDTLMIWSEESQSQEMRLADLEKKLLQVRSTVNRGGDFAQWDLEIRGGLIGSIRLRSMLEEHGGGKQLFRIRALPHIQLPAIVIFLSLLSLATWAASEQEWIAALCCGLGALAISLIARGDCARAMRSWRNTDLQRKGF